VLIQADGNRATEKTDVNMHVGVRQTMPQNRLPDFCSTL